MPNRYVPSALADMVEEKHEQLLDDKGKGDEYPAEYRALVSMLKPEYQDEFEKRHGGS